jgi:TetR/AcrR family transcriptional regulator, tetracycline repressor protein
MNPPRKRAPRHTLDRTTVAAAALDLMDSGGLGALTMRGLARRLGVAPMALYNHAATKDDLLDAARDHALARLTDADPGPDGGPWWARLRAINLAFHGALRTHPSLAALLVARPLGGQAPTAAAEAQVRVLVDAGFSPDAAARAHLTLLHYALGAAAWRAPRVAEPAQGRAALARLPADRYPALAALAGPLAAAAYDDAQYVHGLDLLLSALRAQLAGMAGSADAPGAAG